MVFKLNRFDCQLFFFNNKLCFGFSVCIFNQQNVRHVLVTCRARNFSYCRGSNAVSMILFLDWYKSGNLIDLLDRWVQSAFEGYDGKWICILVESTLGIDVMPACRIKLRDRAHLVTDTRCTAENICLLCVVILPRLKLCDKNFKVGEWYEFWHLALTGTREEDLANLPLEVLLWRKQHFMLKLVHRSFSKPAESESPSDASIRGSQLLFLTNTDWNGQFVSERFKWLTWMWK